VAGRRAPVPVEGAAARDAPAAEFHDDSLLTRRERVLCRRSTRKCAVLASAAAGVRLLE